MKPKQTRPTRQLKTNKTQTSRSTVIIKTRNTTKPQKYNCNQNSTKNQDYDSFIHTVYDSMDTAGSYLMKNKENLQSTKWHTDKVKKKRSTKMIINSYVK